MYAQSHERSRSAPAAVTAQRAPASANEHLTVVPAWSRALGGVPLLNLALPIQTKLTVNQPGDAFEQEADHVAETIMRMPEPHLQRTTCACGGEAGPDGECAVCRAQRLGLQRKAGYAIAPHEAPASVHKTISSSGQPLDATTRRSMESRFGCDFSGVRIHMNDEAAASAKAVGAHAYTVGQNVVFGEGRYAPGTEAGRKLLAHELVHVVQQNHNYPHSISKPSPGIQSPIVTRYAAPSLQRAVSEFCNAPSHWGMAPLMAAGFGLLAEKLIEADYTTKMGVVPGTTVYFDNSLAGPIDPFYVAFIVRKNPSLSSARIVFLSVSSVNRPDMLLDDGSRREYDEIKPDSIPGVIAGVTKLAAIRGYMSLLGLPYAEGTSYTPTSRIPMGSTSVGGVPLEFSLGVDRKRSGLIVYELCIRTDWLKVAIAAAIAAVIAIITLLLSRFRLPVPSPAPVPVIASAESPEEGGSVLASDSNETNAQQEEHIA